MKRFTDKVCIVTGASSGIGKAAAIRYAKEGAKVVINARREDKLKETAKMCEEQGIPSEDAHTMVIDGMAKAAVELFTRCTAQEVASSGVRLNCILPGYVRTDIYINPGGFIAGQPEKQDELHESIIKTIPLGRGLTPEELAGTIMFMTSDEASYITGQNLIIDGGLTGKNDY